jgi:acetyl esterase/lipase
MKIMDLMRHQLLIALVAGLPVLAPSVGFCATEQDEKKSPGMVSNWLRMDKDGDGKVSVEEAVGRLKTSFTRNDADGDGFLTRSELEALAQRRLGAQGRPVPTEREKKTASADRNPPAMSTEELLKLAPDGVRVIPDIVYRPGNQAWKLDLLIPKGRGDAPRAGIIYIHGGGWTRGDKRGQGIGTLLGYAAKGFVCISVNYRLDADKTACVEDVKCATRWFRAHAKQYNVDPNRIGAAGNSAGAHLALMLAVCPASAGLEGDGPYQEYSSRVQSAHCSSTPIMPRFGRGKGLGRDVRKIQPMTYVSGDMPPLFLIHGTADDKAPVSYVDDFVKALREAGAKDTTYRRYADGTGHGAYVKHIDEARPEREAFLMRTLRK